MKPLKLAYSYWLPLKGFSSITLFGFLVRRRDKKNVPVSDKTWTHESIHHAQSQDFHLWYFGYILFYIWYVLEWILKLPSALFGYRPYYSISFEQSAYRNQNNPEYLKNRKSFDWMKYIFKLKKR